MIDRQRQYQQRPPADTDLRHFPARSLAAGQHWWRQHGEAAEPWWFSSDGSGRFDLELPRGTCYLASTAASAIRERVGPDMVAHRVVPAALLAGRVVSRLTLRHRVRAANLDVAAAMRFGIGRELAVMVPYAVPRSWAAALDAAGFGGIVSRLRFNPGRSQGLSLFGDAGLRSEWAVDPSPLNARELGVRMGLALVEPPRFRDVTVVEPPHR